MGRLEFIQYGRDGATWPNVDNNGAYIYALAYDGSFSQFYLARVVRANMANLFAPDWSYYVCPGHATTVCDGSDNASWSGTMSAGTAFAAVTDLGVGGVMYSSEVGVYIATGHESAVGGPQVRVETAPNPWGPWTLAGSMTVNPIASANLGFSVRCSRPPK
jgi:hypothetical protein